MIYGELGRFPLDTLIKGRLVTCWSRIISSDLCRTSCILYKRLYSLYVNDGFPSTWLKHVHCILDHSGLSFIWINKTKNSISGFKNKILQRLKEKFRQNWSSDIQNSNSCKNYRIFKTAHKLENYPPTPPPPLSLASLM